MFTSVSTIFGSTLPPSGRIIFKTVCDFHCDEDLQEVNFEQEEIFVAPSVLFPYI